jgi:CRP-like cAMP-binding protein
MNPTDPFVQLYGHLDAALLADEQFVSEFKNSATLLKVQKGDYLLRAGQVCSEGYFINKGLFLHLFINDQGNESVMGFSVDNFYPFLSSISYFTQTPSDFEILAMEDAELICISRTQIEMLSSRYPLFATFYQRVMMMVISKIYTMYAARQSHTAEGFMESLYNEYIWIVNRVPDKYIARFMGISNAWYCKLKKRLFDSGKV